MFIARRLIRALGVFYIDGGIEMAKNKETYEPLFMSDDDWQNNACINQKVIHDLDLFAEGYKTGGDVLVRHVIKSGSDQDILVYPIVFLYRQHIELRLKEIIREGNRLLDDPPDHPTHHELQKMWPLVKGIIGKVWPHDNDESDDLEFIDHVIHQFCRVDPHSDSFRYPENSNGRNPLANICHINLRHFVEMIERASNFLYGVSAAICDYNESYY
jgi:hypothetical protein